VDLGDPRDCTRYSVFTLTNFMMTFPSMGRKYFQECDRQLTDIAMHYIKQIVSPAILENEIHKIEVAQASMDISDLSFALFKSTKEIIATYTQGEVELSLKMKIPPDYPLKSVESDISKQVKLSERQTRKWILSIRKLLQV